MSGTQPTSGQTIRQHNTLLHNYLRGYSARLPLDPAFVGRPDVTSSLISVSCDAMDSLPPEFARFFADLSTGADRKASRPGGGELLTFCQHSG